MAAQLLLLSLLLSPLIINAVNSSSSSSQLTRQHFTKILNTVINDQSTLQHLQVSNNDNHHRKLNDNDEESNEEKSEEEVWDRLMKHGWEYNKKLHHVSSSSRRLRSDIISPLSSTQPNHSTSLNSPYIICSNIPNQSGYKRRHQITSNLSIPMKQIQTVYNTDEESCFIISTTYNVMNGYYNNNVESRLTGGEEEREEGEREKGDIKFGPLIDVLKLPSSTAMNILQDDTWNPYNNSTAPGDEEREEENEKEEEKMKKWSRSIMIDILPGSLDTNINEGEEEEITLEELANDIVQYVKDMAMIPPPSSRGGESSLKSKSMTLKSSYLRSSNVMLDDEEEDTSTTTTESKMTSTREAFSLTATLPSTTSDINKEEEDTSTSQQQVLKSKRMFIPKQQHTNNIWSTALKYGFEAQHQCLDMFDTLEVRVQQSSKSIVIKDTSSDEDTSGNKEHVTGRNHDETPDSSYQSYGQEDNNNEKADEEETTPLSIELILHSPSQYKSDASSVVESSSWNKHCALSLLMGLSTHPAIQTIEVGLPIVLASMSYSSEEIYLGLDTESNDNESEEISRDNGTSSDSESIQEEISREPWGAKAGQDMSIRFEVEEVSRDERDITFQTSQSTITTPIQGKTNPQWITQSGILNSRPFFESGLDGSNQIVAIADGGLDIDNCYFHDATQTDENYNDAIYGENKWDYTARKIVHYDDSFGDRIERGNGHGTYVSSIVAGKRSVDGTAESIGHADGTAPGSKIAFFDMEVGAWGIDDPGPERIINSLYNANGSDQSTPNKGARVINASWGRSYGGQYTSFCRKYDEMLRNEFSDLLFVVSAGNTGRNGESSIQDPADCKSPLAVGATLSYGTDLRSGELGYEYLADYSSRGPASDSRMKPDIVAPGHFILAAKAMPDNVGECDGNRNPNVKTNVTGGQGVKYTTGTSMASPALAGDGAIIRQYFEEGYCNTQACCGSKGCTGSSMNPSGSLLKAILMNGAQSLTGGVQYVPSGDVLPDQPLQPYDNNQGMGRINLLNSVPLTGKNVMNMKIVNDKAIVDGNKDVYDLVIDKSNDCNRPLSVTLAWYDPPAIVGCTTCLMNDLDLTVKTSTGTRYPNGRNSRDETNTVERIQLSPSNGEEVQIAVNARNFATNEQKYSLAITGCFQEGKASRATDPAPSPPESSTSVSWSSSCPGNRRFEAVINSSSAHNLSWNLIKNENNGIKMILNSSGNQNTKTYRTSACLDPSSRYRFQLRTRNGNVINGRYMISYKGEVVFNSKWFPSSQMGRVSSNKFKTDSDGSYQRLGSNSFVPLTFKTSETAQIGVEGDLNQSIVFGAADKLVYYENPYISSTTGEEVDKEKELKTDRMVEGGDHEASGYLDYTEVSNQYPDMLGKSGKSNTLISRKSKSGKGTKSNSIHYNLNQVKEPIFGKARKGKSSKKSESSSSKGSKKSKLFGQMANGTVSPTDMLGHKSWKGSSSEDGGTYRVYAD